MTFTAKEDYGLRAALTLAEAHEREGLIPERRPLQARDIAALQQIPEPFLEQVLATLRRAGLVSATRGASGGYELARPADQITAADILRALSGPLVPTRLIEAANGPQGSPEGAVVRHTVWRAIDQTLAQVLEGITLKQLLDKSRAAADHQAFGMNI